MSTVDVNRVVARCVSKRASLVPRMVESSRKLIAAWHQDKCICGTVTLLPDEHNENCPYRVFWHESMRVS